MYNIRVTLLALLASVCTASHISGQPNWFTDNLAKIFGGRRENIDKYPFLVSLYRNGNFKCGGSLITPNCVLTAAHCLENNYHSYGLEVTAMQECRGYPLADVQQVQQIIKPSQFELWRGFDMDIAVLKLRGNFKSKKVKPVELQTKPIAPYTQLNVAGWGDTDQYKSTLCLRSTDVTVTTQKKCRIINKPLPQSITENMFCAKGKDRRDACEGDSGGPILHAGKQVGIVSWGVRCNNDFQGVYTRLSSPNITAYLNYTISKFC